MLLSLPVSAVLWQKVCIIPAVAVVAFINNAKKCAKSINKVQSFYIFNLKFIIYLYSKYMCRYICLKSDK